MSLPRIAVDAMGGDEGVQTMVSGAALARRRHDKFKFLLVGDEDRIKRALENHPNMRGASEILHAADVVSGDEKPTQALRRAKTTSMGMAINAVKSGAAGAASGARTGWSDGASARGRQMVGAHPRGSGAMVGECARAAGTCRCGARAAGRQ